MTTSHIKDWLTIVIDALVLGLIMVVLPALLQSTMRRIIRNDQAALGYFGSANYSVIDVVGQLFKGRSKSTEEIKFPKGLGFLRENIISISITMTLLYFIACLSMDVSYVRESISDGQNFIVSSLIQGATSIVGVFIILMGVRLILAEIVLAFKGISEKLVPNSKPALDYPVVLPYTQNTVLIGFFVNSVTSVIGMFILFLLDGVVTSPGVATHFFLDATATVFDNARDGIKDAIADAVLNGILITLLLLLFLPFLGELGGIVATFSNTDFLAVSIVFGNAVKYMGLFGVILSITTVGAIAILLKGRQKE